ncbi:MAG: hypothetical protein ACX931_08585 [Saccharospirillum sp.]
MINSALSAGIAGVQTGMNTLTRSGQEIARGNVPPEQGGPDNLIEPMVQQIYGKNQVEASARVIDVANETLGTLIDLKV